MKIAHVNEIANVPSTLASGLRRLGHEVEVMPLRLLAGKASTPVKLLLLPVRVREILAINERIRRGGFDVVHLHFAYLGWAGILGRYPFYLHCHGTDVRSGLHDRVRRPAVVRALRAARHVFFSTPDLREHLAPVRPDATFLPNPIDVERFCPGVGDGADAGRPRVLFVSALSSVKGVERAFETIEALRCLVPEAQIVVMGFGAQAREYVGRSGITVLQRVDYTGMPDLLRSSTVVVGQLRLGILSMSELEALACGRPLVGEFRYPGTYDRQPPIVTGETPGELAQQIACLLADRAARATAGAAGREWVLRYHDFRAVARTLDGYYRAG